MSKTKETIPEYWLDFIVDTLKQLDVDVQAAFLQRFLQGLLGQEVAREKSITHWEGILARQSQLGEKLARSVTLQTAALDYFEGLSILRHPVLLEYEELKKLRQNARTDPLTGLANRRMFEEFLDQEIDRSTRYGFPFALLSLDLRYFKSVNDRYGHAAGDDILRSVARISLETIRGSDISCRMGGDEFAILLPQVERPGCEALAERIVRKFEEYACTTVPRAPVGIDYGIAIFPDDGHDADSLFTAVDRRLYASKQAGHNPSASRADLSPADAPLIEEPARLGEAEEASRVDSRSLSPFASVAAARTGEEDPIPKNGPGGRRFERIRLEETPALGVVRVGGKTSAVKVLDASRGGVCLLLDQTDLPETFPAFLQVPMLPASELTLQRIYSLPLPEGKLRVGCAFTTLSEQGWHEPPGLKAGFS